MKKILLILLIGFGAAVSGCSETEMKSQSVIPFAATEMGEFEGWLDTYYRATYNIRFLYQLEDIESDMSYDVVPSTEFSSKIIAKMLQFLWLDAYTEVAGLNFMRYNAPRVLHLIGSGTYLGGTLRLGTAEGGVKITVQATNWIEDMMSVNFTNGKDASGGFTLSNFDIENINAYYLHTIHHEFSHILEQNKQRPKDFDNVSAADYTANWRNVATNVALQMGFVSRYASSEATEDFAEIFSTYITSTDNEWNSLLLSAGENGSAAINEKLTIIKAYTKQSWNLDLDKLRETLMRRYQELDNLDWDNFEM